MVLVKKNFALNLSLSKFRMLTCGYRVGSSGCGLNNVPLILELRLSLLAVLARELDLHVCMIETPLDRMSDTTDSTEQMHLTPDADGRDQLVNDGGCDLFDT